MKKTLIVLGLVAVMVTISVYVTPSVEYAKTKSSYSLLVVCHACRWKVTWLPAPSRKNSHMCSSLARPLGE